ncbi:hypothetical protein ABPG74_022392 [Tetrahymena malaccensis]
MSKKPSKVGEQIIVTEQSKDKKAEQPSNQPEKDQGKNAQKSQKDLNSKQNANQSQQQSKTNLQNPAQNEAPQQKQPSKTSIDEGNKKKQSVDATPVQKAQKNDDQRPSVVLSQKNNQNATSQSQLNQLNTSKDSNPSIIISQQELPIEKSKSKTSISNKSGIAGTGENNQLKGIEPIPEEKPPQKQNILFETGLVDAYDCIFISYLFAFIYVKLQIKDFLRQLCKNGLPTGNIFEYAAQEVLKYEKKKKQDNLKKLYQRTGSPLNRTQENSPKSSPKKGENNRNDSIDKGNNKSTKDSQFLKEANSKNKEKSEDQNQPGKQSLQKDPKVEDKKVISKDKVKEEPQEKKKIQEKDENKKQPQKEDKTKVQQQQPPAAQKGKK